jgi:hypothetical protein
MILNPHPLVHLGHTLMEPDRADTQSITEGLLRSVIALLGLDVGVPDTQHFRGAAPAWCSPCRWRTPIRGANDEIRTVIRSSC